MMMNLFSMFDPSSMSFKMSWLVPMTAILIPISLYPSKMSSSFSSLNKFISTEMLSISQNNMTTIMYSAMFSSILLMNMVALLPFTFTVTSQLSVVFPMGLTMWSAIFLHNILSKFNSTMTHLVPMGTPPFLMPIMVLIELVSNIIRPITLSVRLMANLTAGHLLMHLLSSFAINSSLVIPLLPVSLILSSLETAVALIQAYIFSILLTLYSSEIH